MIPQKLTDWNLDVVLEMLSKKLFETELYDYKEALPEKRDQKAKNRLSKTCCAFANSRGGFIVFGIDDDKTKKPADRIKGIDQSLDFPEHFGNYPKNCVPSIYWEFLNPAIKLEDNKVLHVIYIPKSTESPHAVGSTDEGWVFTKRTNKGNEGMPIEEIRNNFLGFYEKNLKLNLLRSELTTIKEDASSWLLAEDQDTSVNYSLVTLECNIIESVLSDSYTILAKEELLLSALNSLRQHIRIANNKIKIFYGTVGLPLTDKKSLVKNHNEFMHGRGLKIVELCNIAISQLTQYINKNSI